MSKPNLSDGTTMSVTVLCYTFPLGFSFPGTQGVSKWKADTIEFVSERDSVQPEQLAYI